MKSKQSNLLNYLLLALLVCGPFFLALCWQAWGMEAARNINSPYPLWGYYAGVGMAFLILVSIFIWPVQHREKKHLAVLWCVKMMVVLGFMLFYESHYGLDAYGYFHRGLQNHFRWSLFIFGQGTGNIDFITSFFDTFLPASFHAMEVLFALIGFIAVYLFYRLACIYRGRDDIRVLYILGLFPSILFWSSILGKDPITLLGIAMYALGVVGYFRKKHAGYLVLVVLGITIASAIRIWLAMIFVIPLGIFFVMGNHGWGRKLVFAVVAVALFIISFQFFADQFAIQSTRDVVQTTNQISQSWASGGSGQQIKGRISSVGDMVTFMPLGAFTALFRPLPGEVMNPFGLLAGLENLFLLSLIFLITMKGNWTPVFSDPLLAWGVVTVIIWACIYGFVSYQNLGSAFRFKLQVMPLLVLLLLELNDQEKTPELSLSSHRR